VPNPHLTIRNVSIAAQLRLHRKNLVERVRLEEQVARGAVRMLNLMLMLLLLLASLLSATHVTNNNSIRRTLDHHFGGCGASLAPCVGIEGAQRLQFRGVRVALGTGYDRVEGNWRAW
jgi:hypothetical protein